MRVSRLFGKTLRDDPTEAELPSHRLMLRAGIIYQVASGVYSYMPLAWRSLRKIEQIIREEMDAAGAQELRMPVLHPRELWEESGRADSYPGLFTLTDRRDRDLVVAPTHEEVLTKMVMANVNSYRDLPLILYQIQTKFRDEARPRGGLLRVREFDMKDAYSFDTNQEGMRLSYQAMSEAYGNIYKRCGLQPITAEADSGAIGGKYSHEFIVLTDSGEDTVVLCDTCGYAANTERAAFAKTARNEESPQVLEDVHTPGIKTIQELADFLHVPTDKTLKVVFYVAGKELVVAVIRGDLEINEIKLQNTLAVHDMRQATPEEVEAAGLVPGSASPIGLSGAKTVGDDSIRLGSNLAAGANKPEYHVLNVNYPRDFDVDTIADIALARDGYPCPNCDGRLAMRRGIEVGHVFDLGTRYSKAFGAIFPDKDAVHRPIVMGCYGIGVGRLLAAVLEMHHDEKGIVFPPSVAPYDVWLMGLNMENEEVARVTEELYQALQEKGVQVLLDDRTESAGVKFNDADLLGLPVRVVVSPRNLRQNAIEVKRRSDPEAVMVPRDEAIERVRELLAG